PWKGLFNFKFITPVPGEAVILKSVLSLALRSDTCCERSVYNRGYAASREQAMRYFKVRWLASIN
ncbi:MAG: hypothetical protein WA706_19495, partial [Pseudolabrys sp.]